MSNDNYVPTGADLELLWQRQVTLQKQVEQLQQCRGAETYAAAIIQLSLISLIFGREIATAKEVTDRIDQMQKNLAAIDARASQDEVSAVLARFKTAAVDWSNPNRTPEPERKFTVIDGEKE
jgi:hypothetical protein